MYMFNLSRNIYFIITDINTKIKLMLVQNYGWPIGPAKIWLWLARRPFGWPQATGPAGSTTPVMCSDCSFEKHILSVNSRCSNLSGWILTLVVLNI